MRLPDYADPIRVRWYRVPEPPANTLWGAGPYGSSDWDDDRSLDPPLGEQSTSRRPFVDWRDCTAPPWCLWTGWPSFPRGLPMFPTFTITNISNGACHDCLNLKRKWRTRYDPTTAGRWIQDPPTPVTVCGSTWLWNVRYVPGDLQFGNPPWSAFLVSTLDGSRGITYGGPIAAWDGQSPVPMVQTAGGLSCHSGAGFNITFPCP